MARKRRRKSNDNGLAWLLAIIVAVWLLIVVLGRAAGVILGVVVLLVALAIVVVGVEWVLAAVISRPMYASAWLLHPWKRLRRRSRERLEDQEMHEYVTMQARLEEAAAGQEWERVIELTQGARNESDEHLEELLLRAEAFAELGKTDAALATYELSLRSQRRHPRLLLQARYSRAKLLLENGQRTRARKEFARVYAQDPNYADVGELIAELEAAPKAPKREPIPEEIQHRVWRRDQGRCVRCNSRERLEFDHIIPLSRGGSNTERNLQLLCERCNRAKGATI